MKGGRWPERERKALRVRVCLRVLTVAVVGTFLLVTSGRPPSLHFAMPQLESGLPVSFGAAAPKPLAVSASLGARILAAMTPPSLVPGPLNGEPTLRSIALRRPIAVIVDNYSPNARPQSGLGAASVVFETLVEGGITRLMAIYLEQDTTKVGPVRSTRIYFDDWAAAFHAILLHVGGNDDAQALLWHLPRVYNLDQSQKPFMLGNTIYYWRTADRMAPYNMYANEQALRRLATRNGQDWAYNGASLPHKRAVPLQDRARSGSLSVSFVDPLFSFIPPTPDYTVRYVFNRATDTYLRIVGGAPQIDTDTGQRLRASNVIVLRTGPGSADPAAGPTFDSITIPVIGSGTAWYFRDGTVERGRWEQKDRFAPLRFLDRRGRPVAFNPGQTWIEVLPQDSILSWTFRRLP